MAKLLLRESNDTVLLDRPFLLKKLLEVKDDKGATALLIACHNKDYSLVELLVESGADVRATDLNGNSAILLAASGPAPDHIPSKELSPAIFKVFKIHYLIAHRFLKKITFILRVLLISYFEFC